MKIWALLTIALALGMGYMLYDQGEQLTASKLEAARLRGQQAAQPTATPPPASMSGMPQTAAPVSMGGAAAAGQEVVDRAALEYRLAQAERDRDQYKAGLEDAVAELNRLNSRHAADLASAALLSTAAPAAPSAPTRPTDYGKVIALGSPDLQVLGDRVLVTGKLWSNRDTDTRVEVTLNFLRDNKKIDSTRMEFVVPPDGEVPYSHYFRFTSSIEGSYAASIEIRPQ